MSASLDEITRRLLGAPVTAQKQAADTAMRATQGRAWIPNPGPQTDAHFNQADEIFFGGEAGGGKSDLILGEAITEHKNSLIIRRFRDDAKGLAERMMEMTGTRAGWNGQDLVYRYDNRLIEFGGCKDEDDKQRYKGRPHDLIAPDEITDLLESQYVFIIAWNRSADPKQRCRVIATGNPPTKASGLWVIKRWAAWLDPNHPNPARDGELRWYTTVTMGGKEREIEVDGPGPHSFPEEPRPLMARSRTFIRSKLADNPDLSETNYGAVLDALPAELRRAYRDGRFDAALEDEAFQVMPTEWVVKAQKRWKPDGHNGLAMTVISADPAGGGKDPAGLAMRYGGWYAPLVTHDGPEKADGSWMAGWIVKHRQDNAAIVIDVGGGYASGAIVRMKDNGISHIAFNGANGSTAKTKDGKLKFANKRSEATWKFREALDPDQQGGSVIALPAEDDELRADLTALTWELTPKGIQVVSKDKIKDLLQRSPTRGDLVVMALSEGDKAVQRAVQQGGYTHGRNPQVLRGAMSKIMHRRR